MKGFYYIVALLVIRFTMELIMHESLPLWRSYDVAQQGMVVGLLLVFATVGACVIALGISDIRSERMKGIGTRF